MKVASNSEKQKLMTIFHALRIAWGHIKLKSVKVNELYLRSEDPLFEGFKIKPHKPNCSNTEYGPLFFFLLFIYHP